MRRYLSGEDRPTLDPILAPCVERYLEMDEDHQVKFKGSAKSFNRLVGLPLPDPSLRQP